MHFRRVPRATAPARGLLSLGVLRTPAPPPTKTVQCLHCRQTIRVAERATTISCPLCARGIRVDDVVIERPITSGPVRTCGLLVVGKRGHLAAPMIEARLGVHVLGRLEGHVLSGGPVILGPKAIWQGDCTAARVVIHPGATILGGRFCILADETPSPPLPPPSQSPASASGEGRPNPPEARVFGRPPLGVPV